MYDEKVNKFLLRILAIMPFFMYAPMAMLGFSNRAIFLNEAQKFNDDAEGGLFALIGFTQITPATGWLVVLPFSVCYWAYSRSGLNL